ncbi:MAG: TolC family protein [Desulfobacteraceae bacterium]|nr:TolC family protein [Desulfobacteraceae bacterium]
MSRFFLKTSYIFVFILALTINVYCGNIQPISTISTEIPSLEIHSLMQQVLENHEEIKSLQSKVDEANAEYLKNKGLWYPTLDLTADGGREKIDKEFSNETNENRYNASLRAEQLITDFGKSSNTIKRAGISLERAKMNLESTRQFIMLEGIKAYINIIRARERLKFARQSEARIKELTGMEKILVEKGAGLTSDVLQAKSQLAGAMALRVETQGELSLAINRFQAVFSYLLDNDQISQFKDIEFPYNNLPILLEDAIDAAEKQNPELLITQYDTQLSSKDIDIAKTAFYPKLNLFAKGTRKDNDYGVKGYSNEYSGGVELNYNLFNGGQDRAALKSALAREKSASFHTRYIKSIVREQVRNSWEQLSILKQRSEFLDQQADIVKEFVVLAKKERKMGTRSLLDVLNGEINYINSMAASIAARQDTKAAAFNLMFAMGQINLQLFE